MLKIDNRLKSMIYLSIAIDTRLRIDAVDAITSVATHASHKVFDISHFPFTFSIYIILDLNFFKYLSKS